MPKPLELTLNTMTPAPMPQAAQSLVIAPLAQSSTRRGREVKPAAKAEPKEPMQVRWPGNEVKAARLAALQLDFPTVSDFMLACFHAYMKASAIRDSTNGNTEKA